MITINISTATFFSRLKIILSCWWPSIASCTCLFWCRIAKYILMWHMMGSMINSIPKMFRRMNDGISGRMKWMKIVSNSQTIPVKEVHFNATEIETCQILERKKYYQSYLLLRSKDNCEYYFKPLTKRWIIMIISLWCELSREHHLHH